MKPKPAKPARKQPVRRHPETGLPRRWICHWDGWIDHAIQDLEWLASKNRKRLTVADYVEMERRFAALATTMRYRALLMRSVITPAQLAYANAEGLSPDKLRADDCLLRVGLRVDLYEEARAAYVPLAQSA